MNWIEYKGVRITCVNGMYEVTADNKSCRFYHLTMAMAFINVLK